MGEAQGEVVDNGRAQGEDIRWANMEEPQMDHMAVAVALPVVAHIVDYS